eukprot:3489253-Alexandrium_andersonii.AAC.1
MVPFCQTPPLLLHASRWASLHAAGSEGGPMGRWVGSVADSFGTYDAVSRPPWAALSCLHIA